ncbi:MAG: hypothetical protein U5O39_13345 [Gammaproteobacteria bacterium]|nr:hypothetical protein [Gammaproteobacteria bacterium]
MSDFFDDDNYNDGFDEDSYRQGMNLDLWKRLLGYTLHYRFEVTMLAICAVATAIAEIAFPLITRAVIDDIRGKRDGDRPVAVRWAVLRFYDIARCLRRQLHLVQRQAAHACQPRHSIAMASTTCNACRFRSTTSARSAGSWHG